MTETTPHRAGALAYVVAILFPVLGVVGAIIQFAKGYVGPGFALLLTSTLAFFCWIALLAAIGSSGA